MPRIDIPITSGYYVNRSTPEANMTCQNMYVHVNQGGGLVPESLFPTEGLNQLATSGGVLETNRGAHVMDGIPYFVNDNSLYRLDRTISGSGAESFALTSLGSVTGSGRVSMADNGTQLIIVVAGSPSVGYIWNKDTTTFSTISDPDFTANGNPQHVVYIDGYFLLTTDTKKFIISNLNDGTAYTATDFGSAEADPDDIVAPVVVNNQLYICGSETLELFRNAASTTGAAFPFLRVEGGIISVGVQAAYSIVNAASTFFFVGGDTNDSPRIYAFTGSEAVPISTDSVSDRLEELTDTEVSNIFGFTYSSGGTTFVGWTLPNITLVYDTTSQRWHERSSYLTSGDTNNETRWRVNSMVKAYGRIICGDNQDGRVGELDADYLDEYGQNIIREFTTIPLTKNGDALFVPEIELTCEAGVGTTASPNPMVSMSRSLDGKTWSDPRERKIGAKGAYRHRAIWRRNGRAARNEMFRFRFTQKNKFYAHKLEMRIR